MNIVEEEFGLFLKPLPGCGIEFMRLSSFIQKGVKFAIAGGLGVLAGLATQYLMTSVFHIYYLDSAIIGYAVGFVVNYVGNIVNGNIKL
jgi:putative flippase GtrA